MRALLVNPAFPESYWSGRQSLPFVRRRSLIPPLPLITVAALLPGHWDCRLVDLNIEDLTDEDLLWADSVMITGMIVQRASMHEVLGRCRRLGVPTVVGGPYVTSMPQDFEAFADHLVVGEGERIVPEMAADLEAGRARPRYQETGKPDLSSAPVPRYDLLKTGAYHHMALQYSRGCPFTCEFCDIIVMYGRVPRTKTAGQVTAELDAIRATGFSGDVFFVDDNFIGNKKAVKTVLPEIAAWRERTRAPLEFYTEASMNIADDERLVDLMTRAGFTAVFIGIESPSSQSLKETRKMQNLRRNVVDQVHWLLGKGLDVWAGFILGFDNDGPDIFDRMIEFVHRAAIPYAMVGTLTALPNTPLHAQMAREGRLLPTRIEGDQFGLSNFITKIPARQMLAGYRRVLESLYDPESYFRRCRENLARWTPVQGAARPLSWSDVKAAMRAVSAQGWRESYRRSYWRFLRWVARRHPTKIGRAVAQAAAGHHYITYTREVVVPTLMEKARRLASGEETVPLAAVAEG